MTRILTARDEVKEVRVKHDHPVTLVNLSSTDRVWVDDSEAVGTDAGLPVEPGGVTVFTPAGGHLYLCRDATHVSAEDPQVAMAPGAGTYINPAASKPITPTAGSYLGQAFGSGTVSWDVTGYTCLELYVSCTGTTNGAVVVSFGGGHAGGSIQLGGGYNTATSSYGGGMKESTGGWVFVPIPGDATTVSVRTLNGTTVNGYGSLRAVDRVTSMQSDGDSLGVSAHANLTLSSATNLGLGAMVGPAWLDWTLKITDTTSAAKFGIGWAGSVGPAFVFHSEAPASGQGWTVKDTTGVYAAGRTRIPKGLCALDLYGFAGPAGAVDVYFTGVVTPD